MRVIGLGLLTLAMVACSAEGGLSEDEAPIALGGPTQLQIAQANQLATMVDFLQQNTAYQNPVDWNALRDVGRDTILKSNGSDAAFFGALYAAFQRVPQGHQTLYMSNVCGKIVPSSMMSQRGVCGRPHARGIIVTSARPDSPLHLQKGDVITRVGTMSGAEILPSLAERPACGSTHPSPAFRDTITATEFSDLLTAGEQLLVESPDGQTRTITAEVPPLGDTSKSLYCRDPFARDVSKTIYAEVRPDGVAVIRLHSFMDQEVPFPTGQPTEAIDAYRAALQAKIQAAFDGVKSAPAIVWDTRGNGGGMTLVGLAIASGFPGARPEQLSYCVGRKVGTEQVEYFTQRGALYALTPGGSFAYSGKVAVLTDGLDYSAADYFPLAVKARTDAVLVGAPTAGAFGATSKTKTFDGPPGFSVGVDMNHCLAAADDSPLEGKSTTPHIAVDYDPADLAAGRDTVLERAVVELTK